MKKILYKILLFVNAFFAFTLLMSYMAVHINPEDFVLPAFFGLAYPYLLLINILLAIIWIVLLKTEVLISLIVIFIGFNHFSNYIRLFKTNRNDIESFQVLSYNIRLFNNFESKNYNNSEKLVLEFLKSQKSDIICLQEFFIVGDPDDKVSAFKKALGGKYFSHLKIMERNKSRSYGIVTFSKYPIIAKGEIVHPGSSSLSIYTDVLIQKDTFRIYNNYLQSFQLKMIEGSFIDELTATDDKNTMDEVKNLSVSLKNGFIRRSQQAQKVKAHINLSPFPVIVTGDFNDTPVSYSYRKIRKDLNDSFVNSGYGAGFTYKGNYPPNRIDYILYDNALINTYFEIIKIKYSDHYPIVAYFRKNN